MVTLTPLKHKMKGIGLGRGSGKIPGNWAKLEALIPFYDAQTGGNFTTIWLTSGETIIDRRKTATVRRSVARYYFVDEGAASRHYGRLLGRRLGIPLVYSSDLIMAPFKVRDVRAKDDGSRAFINTTQIVNVVEDKGAAKLVLTSGRELTLLCSYGHVATMRLAAETVRREFEQLNGVRNQGGGDGRAGTMPCCPSCPRLCPCCTRVDRNND